MVLKTKRVVEACATTMKILKYLLASEVIRRRRWCDVDNKDVDPGEINGREGCMVANPKPRWTISMAKGLAPCL